MYLIIFLIFLLLCVALVLSLYKKGRFAVISKIFRFVIVMGSIAYFTYLFIEKSLSQFLENSMAVQVINHLPQPLDFYIIRVSDAENTKKYMSKHVGKIRPDFYRIEYLNMQKSNEFWIAGYLNKSRLVYFSQHAVPAGDKDQIVEVRNYINQSQKLSGIASDQVGILKYDNMKISIWITLDLLLIFLNSVLLFRRK
ncbi:hypothetical protein G6R40_07020 [Chryseobacterium sp. POL2]|uniref:hypothetical protein n=1 Tax=Chryseobacterium sp. POL2 TaxID=2713414 RepID=UPI0013E1CA72|nr:hypothetical protein [Chryseobacterium sp. POL2]QIG89436.1 hypothetical protein G6R40_07020 [Chryseobacterium sp. POL2]